MGAIAGNTDVFELDDLHLAELIDRSVRDLGGDVDLRQAHGLRDERCRAIAVRTSDRSSVVSPL